MKQLMALLGSFCLLLGLPACKTKQYTPTELPDKRIVFGNGGGFTGAVSEYVLLENGQMFQKASLSADTLSSQPDMRKKVCRQAFKSMAKMDTTLLGAQQPGNRYFFLHYFDGKDSWQTTWGANGYEIAMEVKEVYDLLMEGLQATKEEEK